MYFNETQDYANDPLARSSKKCTPQETVIYDVSLANAYVPYQKLCKICSPTEGLRKGTIFPELYSPYEGRKMKKLARETEEESFNYGL